MIISTLLSYSGHSLPACLLGFKKKFPPACLFRPACLQISKKNASLQSALVLGTSELIKQINKKEYSTTYSRNIVKGARNLDLSIFSNHFVQKLIPVSFSLQYHWNNK